MADPRETRRLSTPDTLYGIAIPPRPEPEIPFTTPELNTHPTRESYPITQVQKALQAQADQTARVAEQQAGLTPGTINLPVVDVPSEIGSDLAIACFPLAKPLRESPVVIAERLALNVSDGDPLLHVRGARAERGYLNFDLDPQSMGTAIVRDVETKRRRYGEVNIGNGATVVIDYSAPNIAKFMSVGHLRSTVIGNSLVNIYRAGGYEVIGDNHIGDWGTQFGMLGRAHELWGDEVPSIRDGTNPVQGLYELYVRIHAEAEEQKKTGQKGELSPLEKEGRAWFKRLEAGDANAHQLLKWATSLSHQEFQRVYDLLRVKFEYQLGESAYVGMLGDVNRTLSESGVATRDEKGGLVVNFTPEQKLGDRLVIQKSDGTSLYATRDIATIAARQAWFNPSKILYVVGGEQQAYFKQLFATYEQLSEGGGPELEHVYFGKVSDPDGGKMSTRKGNVIFLEDVLTQAIDKARIKVRQTNPNLSDGEVETIARQVGVGAIMYMDLGQGRERNIKLDLDQALSFQGNSGPYIQYAHARGAAILRRGMNEGIPVDPEKPIIPTTPTEQALVKELGRMHMAVEKAIEENQPTRVAGYVYGVADRFSNFYHENRVLDEQDTDTRESRLRITAATTQVLNNGLRLLGMEAPEKM